MASVPYEPEPIAVADPPLEAELFEYEGTIAVSVVGGEATAWDPDPRPFPRRSIGECRSVSREEFDRLRAAGKRLRES